MSDEPSTPRRPEPVEEASLWRLPLGGLRVWRLALGLSVELELDEDQRGSGTAVKIAIHGPFFCGPEPGPSAMDPQAADRSALGPVLNLFQSTVTEAIAYKSGRLEVRFGGGRDRFSVDGWVLQANPDTKYESWEIRGPSGQLIVSGPGGQLSIWSGEPTGTVDDWTRNGFFDSPPFKRDR